MGQFSMLVGDYAVIVNTKHNKVLKQLDNVFTEAAFNIDTGWHYSIEVTGKILTHITNQPNINFSSLIMVSGPCMAVLFYFKIYTF